MSQEDIEHIVEAWAQRLKLATWLLAAVSGVWTVIGIGAVGWAITIQSDVAVIRHAMEAMEVVPQWLDDSVKQNARDLDDLEKRVRAIENHSP